MSNVTYLDKHIKFSCLNSVVEVAKSLGFIGKELNTVKNKRFSASKYELLWDESSDGIKKMVFGTTFLAIKLKGKVNNNRTSIIISNDLIVVEFHPMFNEVHFYVGL